MAGVLWPQNWVNPASAQKGLMKSGHGQFNHLLALQSDVKLLDKSKTHTKHPITQSYGDDSSASDGPYNETP